MKQYSITMEPKLVQSIDVVVGSEGLYSSRNDFIRDAIRARLIEVRKEEIDRRFKALADDLRARGVKPRMPTDEDKQAAYEAIVRKVKARTPAE